MIVIDANAAIEVARGTSRGLLFADYVLGSDKIVAPTLFISETANAVWKYAVHGSPSLEDWQLFFDSVVSEVDEFIPDEELFPEALSEAIANRHPVYDMLYLVLARRTASPLLTCDSRLAKLCEKNNVECVQIADV